MLYEGCVACIGVVFLMFRNETRPGLLPNEVSTINTVWALFVRAFPDALSMHWFESSKWTIYFLDQHAGVYRVLQDLRSVCRRGFVVQLLKFRGAVSAQHPRDVLAKIVADTPDLLRTSSRGCHEDAARKTASVEFKLHRPACICHRYADCTSHNTPCMLGWDPRRRTPRPILVNVSCWLPRLPGLQGTVTFDPLQYAFVSFSVRSSRCL